MRIIRIFIAIMLPPLSVFGMLYFDLKSSGFIVSLKHGIYVLYPACIFEIFPTILYIVLIETAYNKGINPKSWKSVLLSVLLFMFSDIFSSMILSIISGSTGGYIPLVIRGGLIGLMLGFCNKIFASIYERRVKRDQVCS